MNDNRHTAFRGLFDMFAEMGRMREQWTQTEPGAEGRTHAGAWVPTVDIYAEGENLFIRCELAGIPKQDVGSRSAAGSCGSPANGPARRRATT